MHPGWTFQRDLLGNECGLNEEMVMDGYVQVRNFLAIIGILTILGDAGIATFFFWRFLQRCCQ